MLDLAIRGGTVVTATQTFRADVGVAGEKVVALGEVGPAHQKLAADGLLVLPGCVDAHTHLDFQPLPDGPRGADDFYDGTVAAAFGGVTTVIDYARAYPHQSPLEGMLAWDQRARGNAVVDYAFHVLCSRYTPDMVERLPEAVAAGFPTIKVFMTRTTEAEFLAVLEKAAELGALVMVHAESGPLIEHRHQQLRAAGTMGADHYVESRPELAEAEAVSRAIDYAEQTGARICLVHLSCRASVERVRQARARGRPVWAEVRPCYLLLSDEVYARPGVDPLMHSGCPPYRPAENIPHLWQALADGTLDLVASDHAPWKLEQKEAGRRDLSQIPHGIPALETELATLYTDGVAGGRISMSRLVEALSTAPARLHGLYPAKGTVAVGSDADLVLFAPDRPGRVELARMHSRTGYEPTDGMALAGGPVATIGRGEVICRDGELLARPGRGRLLRRRFAP